MLWKWENYFSFLTIIPTPDPPSSQHRHSIFTQMPNTVKWFITSSKSNQMRKWESKTEIFIKLYFYSIIFMIRVLLGCSGEWRRKHWQLLSLKEQHNSIQVPESSLPITQPRNAPPWKRTGARPSGDDRSRAEQH